MSYSGYMGARLFRRDLTRVYLTYLALFALARVALRGRGGEVRVRRALPHAGVREVLEGSVLGQHRQRLQRRVRAGRGVEA